MFYYLLYTFALYTCIFAVCINIGDFFIDLEEFLFNNRYLEIKKKLKMQR